MFTILDVLPPIKGVRSVAGTLLLLLYIPRVRDSLLAACKFFQKIFPNSHYSIVSRSRLCAELNMC